MAAPKATLTAEEIRHWTVLVTELPPLSGGTPAVCAQRARLLQRIDDWLRRHHHAVALPAIDSEARGRAVCVSFRRDEAATALAWRHFCGELGLSARLKQFRVKPNRCARTTPTVF